MFTPASNPAWLTRTNSAAGPWNQVAVIQPSSCQTDANVAQSPESRAIAQVSMTRRIRNSSASCSVSMRWPLYDARVRRRLPGSGAKRPAAR